MQLQSVIMMSFMSTCSLCPSSIELGQFFHINWGWREYLTSGGNIAYPWKAILENTIGSGGQTAETRVAAFKQANAVLSNLIIALKDQDKYSSKADMENKLINCEGEVNSSESQHLANCASLVFFGESGGSSYISVGPGDGGAAFSSGESTFGKPLAYPSEWKPSADFYESRSLKVASCLVVQGSLSLVEMSNSMGCSTPDHSEPALPANQRSAKTTEVLAWLFGILLACSLVIVTVFFERKDKHLKNDQTMHTATKEKDVDEYAC